MIYEVNEKQQRIKYIRVLEKFFTRTISLLKLDNFDKDLFKQRTKKNYEELVKTKEIELYSDYYESIKVFINKTMFYLEEHTKSFEEERANLLKGFTKYLTTGDDEISQEMRKILWEQLEPHYKKLRFYVPHLTPKEKITVLRGFLNEITPVHRKEAVNIIVKQKIKIRA